MQVRVDGSSERIRDSASPAGERQQTRAVQRGGLIASHRLTPSGWRGFRVTRVGPSHVVHQYLLGGSSLPLQVGEVAPGGQGVGVVRAEDPKPVLQKVAVGGGRASRASPRQKARLPRTARVSGWFGPTSRCMAARMPAREVAAPVASPDSPCHRARMLYVTRVSGWNGPRRSRVVAARRCWYSVVAVTWPLAPRLLPRGVSKSR